MEPTEKFYILTGGTRFKVAPHFSLSSDAYGSVGRSLFRELEYHFDESPFRSVEVILIETRMALRQTMKDNATHDILSRAGMPSCREFGIPYVDTVEQMDQLVKYLTSLPDTRCIVMTSAVCDFQAEVITPMDLLKGPTTEFGPTAPRLSSKEKYLCQLTPANKIVDHVRKKRKDIFLVLFKTTTQESKDISYKRGLDLLKRTSANLVLANDLDNGEIRHNQIITPEEFPYHYDNRGDALVNLAQMIVDRTNLTFSRTIVKAGIPAYITPEYPQYYGKIPDNFEPVLRYLVENKAFKPFNGTTTGHFGCRVEPYTDHVFQNVRSISSARHSDHNKVFEEGMVAIERDGDQIIGYGRKPSAGERTQQELYDTYPEVDCIVHFHCPLSEKGQRIIPRQSQKAFECGSHECALNTKEGFFLMNGENKIWAVHLEGHGPNIGFSKDSDPEKVIEFITSFWDLEDKEGV